MKTIEIVECVAAGIMLLGIGGVIFQRIKTGMGIGARVIQFSAVVLVVPAIMILALEKVLTPETTATLFGTITGYLLSGIGDYKPKLKRRPGTQSDEPDKTL